MKVQANKFNNEMQEEMAGLLTAISIVSKRMAIRILELNEKKGANKNNEQN